MSSTSVSSSTAQADQKLVPWANLARLLSDVFWEPLPFSPEAMGHLKQASEAFGPAGAQAFAAFEQVKTPQDLAPLYSKLFLGPFELLAAPYASVYLEGDESSAGVTRDWLLSLYSQGGYELPPRAGDLPDHLAVELEFFYLSLANYLLEGDEAALERALNLRQHLAAWLPDWQKQLVQYEQAEYYARLADLVVLLLDPSLDLN